MMQQKFYLKLGSIQICLKVSSCLRLILFEKTYDQYNPHYICMVKRLKILDDLQQKQNRYGNCVGPKQAEQA